METNFINELHIVGITVRTTNENGRAKKDIPALWQKFFAENVSAKVENKLNDNIYCIYTDYEKDHTKPYTTIVGYAVQNVNIVPEGLVAKFIAGGTYTKFTAKGKLDAGAVYNEWLNIWNTAIDRNYTTDFEVYDEKSLNQIDAEVNIFVAVK